MNTRENLSYNVLVIGLGSMGKRRIRCLQSIGFTKISGFDIREDRRTEAKNLYGIEIVDDAEELINSGSIDVCIISVPPDIHARYMQASLAANTHFFVEASVVANGLDEVIKAHKEIDIVAAPSGTLFFHPGIRKIFEIIGGGELGTITNFIYHAGQYLPDWHTYEDVSEYYVSNKETGGAREILPFELTWITKLFGFPNQVTGIVKKTMDIEGAENIDDTYNALLDYDHILINIVVDVVSRKAIRKLLINGSKKQLMWNWDENVIEIFNPETESLDIVEYDVVKAAEGYNQSITEQMYIDELLNFFDAIEGSSPFFNTLEEDQKVLNLLYAIEESSTAGRTIQFDK